MADIIRTVTTIVIMRIAFTGMAVGIIIDEHRGQWWDSATPSADAIFREHVRALPWRERLRVVDIVQKLSGQLNEMSVVPEPQAVGNGHPPFPAPLFKARTGMEILRRRDPTIESRADAQGQSEVDWSRS